MSSGRSLLRARMPPPLRPFLAGGTEGGIPPDLRGTAHEKMPSRAACVLRHLYSKHVPPHQSGRAVHGHHAGFSFLAGLSGAYQRSDAVCLWPHAASVRHSGRPYRRKAHVGGSYPAHRRFRVSVHLHRYSASEPRIALLHGHRHCRSRSRLRAACPVVFSGKLRPGRRDHDRKRRSRHCAFRAGSGSAARRSGLDAQSSAFRRADAGHASAHSFRHSLPRAAPARGTSPSLPAFHI